MHLPLFRMFLKIFFKTLKCLIGNKRFLKALMFIYFLLFYFFFNLGYSFSDKSLFLHEAQGSHTKIWPYPFDEPHCRNPAHLLRPIPSWSASWWLKPSLVSEIVTLLLLSLCPRYQPSPIIETITFVICSTVGTLPSYSLVIETIALRVTNPT